MIDTNVIYFAAHFPRISSVVYKHILYVRMLVLIKNYFLFNEEYFYITHSKRMSIIQNYQ